MRWRALVLVGCLVAAACSGGDDDDTAPRPPDEPPTSAVDYSGVALERVDGDTTTTAVQAVGTASIIGSVAGPSGLVPGATVRIERIVGGQEVRTDVITGPDGRFEVRGIPGGRYRVRAFLAPALALLSPDVRFLRDGQEHTFDLVMEDQRRIVARGSVAPDPPYLGDDVNLAIVVATRTVDADGIVRSVPVTGVRVELDGLGAWSLRVPNRPRSPLQPRATTTTTSFSSPSAVAFTDSAGTVRYELLCRTAGDPGLGLLLTVTSTPATVPGGPPAVPEQRVERIAIDVADCVDPESVTVPADGDGGDDGGTDDGTDGGGTVASTEPDDDG